MTLFSVIIPAYNQAEFIGETIQSVLNQSYSNFEIIIVNDGSTDHTSEIVQSFEDRRIKYIQHEVNKGLPAARNTGMQAAKGSLIALLDADDLFHPDKLQVHAAYMETHPDVQVTYNNRFELNHSATTIRDLYRPPATVSLCDLVQGFVFTPSDMVLRADANHQLEFFNEQLTSGGEDLDYPLRLALKGYKFANVDRALNYRRYHAGRKRKNLLGRLADYTYALETAFTDPRCPQIVLSLRQVAFLNFYLEVAYTAFYQEEGELGCDVLKRIRDLDPFRHGPETRSNLLNNYLYRSLANENDGHGQVLRKIFTQFPTEMAPGEEEINRAIAYGYFNKGARAIMWGRSGIGSNYFQTAKQLGGSIDYRFTGYLTQKLLDYENEFGYPASSKILGEMVRVAKNIGNLGEIRKIKGSYEFNRALREYKQGYYNRAMMGMIRAGVSDPRFLMNAGYISVISKSILKILMGEVPNALIPKN